MNWLLWIYGVGAVLGLVLVDGPLSARLILALLWPVGVLAFAVTIALLLIVAAIAFPLFGLLVALALAGNVAIDPTRDPIGLDRDGAKVHLTEIWPTDSEVAAAVASAAAVERRQSAAGSTRRYHCRCLRYSRLSR